MKTVMCVVFIALCIVLDGWCRTLHKGCANSWSAHICGEVHFILFTN